MVTVLASTPRPPLTRISRSLAGPVRNGLRTVAESRPAVQLVFALRALAGSDLIRHPSVERAETVTGWLLVTVAIYVFNGVADRIEDAANHSARPIASGALTRRAALTWCIGLSVVGLSLCGAAGAPDFVLAIAMLVLGWAYSVGPALKNAPAGFAAVIGLGAGLTYVAGWAARGRFSQREAAFVAALALWVALCCAAKDFSDLDGDRLAGRRTWPVLLGARSAARLLALLAMCGAAVVVVTSQLAGLTPLPAIVISTGSVVLGASAIRHADSPDRQERRRPYRVFMITQYITNGALIVLLGA
jgi:4-hydroxybenzoate polyprenyltransferase